MESLGGSGPADDRRRAEIGERLKRLRAAVLAGPPFRVLGLSSPALAPAWLAGFEQVGDVWVRVGLMYGDIRRASGPFVWVVTTAPGVEAEGLDVALDDERDRLADHAGSRSRSRRRRGPAADRSWWTARR